MGDNVKITRIQGTYPTPTDFTARDDQSEGKEGTVINFCELLVAMVELYKILLTFFFWHLCSSVYFVTSGPLLPLAVNLMLGH